MADGARVWTDKELKKIEKRIKEIYEESEKELTKKWNDYFSAASKRLTRLQNEYDKVKLSGDEEAVKTAYNALEREKKNLTFRNDDYQKMLNKTTTALTDLNQTAVSYINGQMPPVYTKNYNQIAKDAEKLGIDFHTVDQHTVAKLVKDGDIKLPYKTVNVAKDKLWNTKQLNSSVLQGILQGESMDKIAKRILPVVDNNSKAAIRTARTMVTGAENAGRLDSYEEMENEGVVLHKVWIATGDDRTRDWHLVMDGQEVDVNDDFTDGNGNTLAYPGDPSAEPETVYNCRCSMKTHIIGFRKADGSIKEIDYEKPETSFHKEQINAEKERREEEKKQAQTPVNGKDITDTWTRRPAEFDFEIDDVVNAQGFDGLPKIVSEKEFDQAVKQSNFIAQRVYSADSQALLDSYQEQLYNGKWYVDCSTGGALYGQGMYTVSFNGKVVTDSMKKSIKGYSENKQFVKVETFTLQPNSKIANYEDIKELVTKEATGFTREDVGVRAAKLGYDAINVPFGNISKSDYTIVLNRTKLIIKDERP